MKHLRRAVRMKPEEPRPHAREQGKKEVDQRIIEMLTRVGRFRKRFGDLKTSANYSLTVF